MSNPAIAGLAQLRNMVPELRPTHVWNEAVDVSVDEQKLTRLLVKLKRRRLDDYEFLIAEEDAPLPYFTVTAGEVGGDAKVFKVAAADGVLLGVNTPVRRVDGSYAIITDVTSGETEYTITVDTDIGVVTGSVLVVGARAFEENSAAPSPVTFNPVTRRGYQQITRIAWGESRMVRSVTSFLKETRVAANRRQAFRWARQTIEAGLLFNPAKKETNPLRYYAGGLIHQNTVNKWDNATQDGSFTYEMLEDWMVQLNRSRDQLLGLTSAKVASEIRKIVWKKSQNAVVEGDWMGVPVTNVRIGNKRIQLLESENFVGEFQYHLHILDPQHIGIVTTYDQETQKANWFLLDTNAKTPGQDGSLNVLTIDWGFEMTARERQCRIGNLKKGTV